MSALKTQTKSGALFFFLLMLSISASGKIIYVKTTSTGLNNGTSWANAYGSISTAIGAAVFGDSIWLKSGTYIFYNRVLLKNGTHMFGGFAGTETSLSQRNLALNTTTLSGENGTIGDPTDNEELLFEAYNLSWGVTIDGFFFRDAYNEGSTVSYGPYGSAILARGSKLTIRNCTFMYNYAEGDGGAMHLAGSDFEIDNCKFLYNTAVNNGGAIYVNSGNVIITNCIFTGNETEVGGGSAVLISTGNNQSRVDRCIFSGNLSPDGSAVMGTSNTSCYDTISNCVLVGNKCLWGSVIGMYNNSLSGRTGRTAVINCTVAHNISTLPTTNPSYEPAIYVSSSSVTASISNCIAYGNRALAPMSTLGNCYNNITDNPSLTNNGNLYINPQFVNGAAGYAQAPFFISSYDYHLSALSPGIDAGVNTYFFSPFLFDADNNTRKHGPKVDIGAYENGYCTFSPQLSNNTDSTTCWGKTITLTAPAGLNYQWSTGATTKSITVSQSGNYSLLMVDSSSCRGNLSQKVIVDTPKITLDIIGKTPFCPGDKAILKSQGYTFYAWSNLSNADSIIVTNSGNYTLIATDSNGCKCMGSKSIQVTNSTFPISLTSPTNFNNCLGKKVTLNISGGDTYTWSNGATDTTITVSTSGNYSVSAVKNFCVTTATRAVNLTPGNITIRYSPDTIACAGSNITLAVDSGKLSYRWNNSANTKTFTASASGLYAITVTEVDSCLSIGKINVVFNPLPNVVIVAVGTLDLIATTNFAGYQWYRDGVKIPGAIFMNYTPTQNGIYSLEGFDNNGCSSFSNEIQITNVSIHEIDSEASVHFNYANKQLLIQSQKTNMHFSLYNAFGQIVMNHLDVEKNIDLNGLSAGLYFVVTSNNKSIYKLFIE
jgi:predicted outer membrane repeat protein